MNQFCQRNMRPGETFSQYCHAILKLLDRGCPGCEDNTRNRLQTYASNNRQIPRKSTSFNIDAVEEDLNDNDNDTRTGAANTIEIIKINALKSKSTLQRIDVIVDFAGSSEDARFRSIDIIHQSKKIARGSGVPNRHVLRLLHQTKSAEVTKSELPVPSCILFQAKRMRNRKFKVRN